MNMFLRLFTFTFWISPNLANYTYGWSPLIEQPDKIEKKTLTKNNHTFFKSTFNIKYNHFLAMASFKISFWIVDLYFIQVLEDNLWTFKNESEVIV
jgi:hypothetical protein